MIEKYKFEQICQEAKRMEYTPVYICSTPSGIWGFNLGYVSVEWEVRELPWQTDFKKVQKVRKDVGYLSVVDGKPYSDGPKNG